MTDPHYEKPNIKIPIVDRNNVKVFLLDQTPVNWYNAREYQTWAYIDFIYSGDTEKYYMTKKSTHAKPIEKYTTIPIDNIDPNIIFRIFKNNNGVIFYEKNDIRKTRIRISDDDFYRCEYYAFYMRMTSDINIIPHISNTHNDNPSLAIPPEIDIIETLDDEEMCVVCNNNRQNIKFCPCNHTNTCSECYKELLKNKQNFVSCPICRSTITQIIPYTPQILHIDNKTSNTHPSKIHRSELIQKKPPLICHPHSSNWFLCAFGFKEQSYFQTKSIFQKMMQDEYNTHLNGIQIGQFELLNKKQLQDRLLTIPMVFNNGCITLENIIDDIHAIHQNPLKSANATIQVASQFNCLEMVNPNRTPENGITDYQFDKTQGPICAMAAPAGLAYRNYLYNGGQTNLNQIDMTADLLRYLQTFDPTIYWNMQNGYLIFDNEENLRKINRVLFNNPNIKKNAKNLIQSGSHINQGVFIQYQEYQHIVNHVYCSGLPITYNKLPVDIWDALSEIFLETMYENTLMIAYMNNLRSGQNRPCYLTQVGGGVFGMKHSQIIKAIHKTCHVLAKKGLKLDVKVVHYGSINSKYNKLSEIYPILNDNIINDSVLNDDNWLLHSL